MNDDALLSAPGTKAGKLQRACLELLRQHERDGALPTNGRFLFYELEQMGVIPKKYRDNGNEDAYAAAGCQRRDSCGCAKAG